MKIYTKIYPQVDTEVNIVLDNCIWFEAINTGLYKDTVNLTDAPEFVSYTYGINFKMISKENQFIEYFSKEERDAELKKIKEIIQK